ncbi:MAG: TetR family transcriptional regulator [Thermoleophilaceae bacterium]|nr:TetR family transcriptional regulator [Thermoleophilaceae bacterium]
MSPTTKTGAYREAARDLLRASLLDAAGELMQDAPWSEISMAAIATQAGVSRQTLYNEFGSRDVFAQTFALRAADKFLIEVEDAFTSSPDNPYRALEVGFTRFLELAESDPMVRHIVVRDPGADELLSLFTSRGGPVVDLATKRLAAKMVETWPEAEPAAAKTLAEGLVRLGISHAGLSNGTPKESALEVLALLAPYIDQHLSV